MSVIESVMKLFFGDKSAKDIKQIMPLVNKTLSYGEALKALSNDELRAKTQEFKDRIHTAVADKEAEIASLEAQAEAENDNLERKEALFNQADELKKEVYKITENILNEILPEAFAVVKETARRFAENPVLEVTAQPFDRQLSATHPNVTIEGDRALWSNTWDAAGKPVTWDMVHYDVQLIGGVVLHQGKIAEMATGEGKTLVATLPIYLNALPGKGVHVVTVNNYLSRRDAAWMGPLFQFNGAWTVSTTTSPTLPNAVPLTWPTSLTGPTASLVSITCATTAPARPRNWCSANTTMRSWTRWTRC